MTLYQTMNCPISPITPIINDYSLFFPISTTATTKTPPKNNIILQQQQQQLHENKKSTTTTKNSLPISPSSSTRTTTTTTTNVFNVAAAATPTTSDIYFSASNEIQNAQNCVPNASLHNYFLRNASQFSFDTSPNAMFDSFENYNNLPQLQNNNYAVIDPLEMPQYYSNMSTLDTPITTNRHGYWPQPTTTTTTTTNDFFNDLRMVNDVANATTTTFFGAQQQAEQHLATSNFWPYNNIDEQQRSINTTTTVNPITNDNLLNKYDNFDNGKNFTSNIVNADENFSFINGNFSSTSSQSLANLLSPSNRVGEQQQKISTSLLRYGTNYGKHLSNMSNCKLSEEMACKIENCNCGNFLANNRQTNANENILTKSAADSTTPNQQATTTTNKLKKSSEITIKSRQFSCYTCEKQYCRKSTLKIHMKQHVGERPFICQICEKSFSQAANLTAHKRVHTGERPFTCTVCYRPFSQSSSLVTHKRTHTGERPYSCNHCAKSFTDSSTLTKHLRTHTGQKPYSCDLCLMQFSQSGNLHRHMKTHVIE